MCGAGKLTAAFSGLRRMEPPSFAVPFGEALGGRDVLFEFLLHLPLKLRVAAARGDVFSDRLPHHIGDRRLVRSGDCGEFLPEVFIKTKAHRFRLLAFLGGHNRPGNDCAPTLRQIDVLTGSLT